FNLVPWQACRGRLVQQRSSSPARMLWNCEVPATWYHALQPWYHATISTTTRLPVPLLTNHANHTPKIVTRPARGGRHPPLITHMTVRAAAPPHDGATNSEVGKCGHIEDILDASARRALFDRHATRQA